MPVWLVTAVLWRALSLFSMSCVRISVGSLPKLLEIRGYPPETAKSHEKYLESSVLLQIPQTHQ